MRNRFFVVLIMACGLIQGRAALAAAAPVPAGQVKTSTASAAPGVGSIYAADKLRDPFMMQGASGAVAKSTGSVEFSIHNLILRGLMKDAGSEYAVFGDDSGASYVLRQGRLYNFRGKAVDGISGKTNIRQKTASLMTPDKDVQIFRLGEEEKEAKE